MRITLKQYKKSNYHLQQLKKDLRLSSLDDISFIEAIEYFIKFNIKKADILVITKHLNISNFNKEVIVKAIHYKNSNKHKKLAYDVEYIALRNNISIEDAKSFINNYKKTKNTSLESFILRYGKEIGEQKFTDFQRTSAYSSSDEWFKQKYGDLWKIKKKERFQNTPRSIKYWTDQGIEREDAKILVSNFQKNNSGVHKEYYMRLGLSQNEIEDIFLILNKKKGYSKKNKQYHIDKHGNNWLSYYEDVQLNIRKIMEDRGLWTPLSLLDDYVKYKQLCLFYTRQSLSTNHLDDIGKRSIYFHVDHMFSIKQGFIQDINPKIIGSIVNLQILPRSTNFSKQAKCSITYKQLLKLYNQHINHEN